MPWYIEHRLDEQMRYYANGQTENEEGVRRYRVAGFAAAVIAAILGVAASNFGQGWFAPWVGVMTTLAAAAVAYGLLDRRQYLAGAYGAMVTRLSRVKELFADHTGDLPALVTTTEDLLQSEHGAWVERTTQTMQHRAIWHRRRRAKTTARSTQKASIRTKPEVHWSMKQGLSRTT
jgi:hypothetical protein